MLTPESRLDSRAGGATGLGTAEEAVVFKSG